VFKSEEMGLRAENIRARRCAVIGALAAGALTAATALAGATAAEAGILDDPPKAELATTGNDSERIRAVPIATTPGTKERVAMSLGPDELKRIQAGDRWRVSAEVQVSTTCHDKDKRCIGRRYNFNPKITARIVLAPAPDAAAASIPLSETRQVLCKQRRPNRNHHCTLALPNTEHALDPAILPCPANACYANLLVGAFSKRAERGNRVVLGADLPDKNVKQDKGRLNVVQLRATVPQPRVSSSGDLVNATLPLTEGPKEKRRVVYSVPIVSPRKGEVLAFDSSYVAEIGPLRYNTFIATRVIVAETPTSTASAGLARFAAPLRGAATESNGFNCTQGRSGFANPCTSVKAGATRIIRDPVDDYGVAATVYLNVVAAAKPLLVERQIRGTPQITLAPATGLTVSRWPAPAR
jgi:hypothetical protein